MKFAFYTLGCKTNQYETQAMEHFVTELGHTLGRFDEACDAYVNRAEDADLTLLRLRRQTLPCSTA